ncbi:MAG: hypothetical protein AAF675_20505 [Pseudomonadota bacterium]
MQKHGGPTIEERQEMERKRALGTLLRGRSGFTDSEILPDPLLDDPSRGPFDWRRRRQHSLFQQLWPFALVLGGLIAVLLN